MHIKKIILSLATLLIFSTDVWADSAIYACGHIRRERTTAIPKLKMSGYNTVILFNINVEPDGSLCTDYNWANSTPDQAGGIVCKNGEYIFDKVQPYFAEDVSSLLVAPTSVNRIEICIGGWLNGSYGNIKNLIDKYGTGEDTELYRNFKALHERIPEIMAVNNDQEQDYDVAAATAFHKMLAKIGFKTAIAPYTQRNFWKQLVENLNAEEQICDIVYLQTYAGGASNRPADWDVFGDIPMWVGFDCEASGDISAMENLMKNFRDSSKACGGFLWNYNNEARNLNEWASTINRIFDSGAVADDDAVVTFYEKRNFSGYSVSLAEGEYTQPDLAVRGIQAAHILSMEIKEGYKVTLNSGQAFDGVLNIQFNESSDFFGPQWISRGVASLKIEKNGEDNSSVALTQQESTDYVEYYNLQGQKLNSLQSLPSGIYIEKRGTITNKIIKK